MAEEFDALKRSRARAYLESVRAERVKVDALRDELDKRMNLLHKTEMQALLAQLNPHFIFNTLDVVGILIEEAEPPASPAAQVADHLAAILRYSLAGIDLVDLETELRYTRQYLFIRSIPGFTIGSRRGCGRIRSGLTMCIRCSCIRRNLTG